MHTRPGLYQNISQLQWHKALHPSKHRTYNLTFKPQVPPKAGWAYVCMQEGVPDCMHNGAQPRLPFEVAFDGIQIEMALCN